ncbi:MAG: nucleotide exchange factor GrpE [Leptospiraceae bacterium]|jgi:molecular chaperone GrpE|nr:nucleotide exchange factor GrpE [Leptospiraceae bacterium]MCZ8344907.1 nucleotide exchange factor GrpE [Leptospiraceae bacterium]
MAEDTNTETIPQEESSNSEENPVENIQTEAASAESALELELKKAKEEALNFKDSWQRERAEFTNYKRRTASELLNSRKEAVKNFIHDLLNPIDNLELVTNVTTEIPELKAYVDGVNMVKKELLSVIEKEGIKRLNPVNESFDPMLMEAINSVESEEYKEETVVEVYQPGYYYLDGENQHSIRPARVKVGKPLSNG